MNSSLLILIPAAIISNALYFVHLKRFAHCALEVVFWVMLIDYLVFSTLIFLKNSIIYDLHEGFHATFINIGYINFPLYAISGLAMLTSTILFNRLLLSYPLGLILGMVQMVVLINVLSFKLLGDNVEFSTIIGALIIFIGACLSAVPNFSIAGIIHFFSNVDMPLFIGTFLQATFNSISFIFTYLCTTKSAEPLLNTIDYYIPQFHFAKVDAFHFNVGILAAIALFILAYTIYKERLYIIGKLIYYHTLYIFSAAFCFFIYIYTNYTAFGLLTNKSLLMAMINLYLPLTLLISHIMYKEEITIGKIVGMSMIIIGGLLPALL